MSEPGNEVDTLKARSERLNAPAPTDKECERLAQFVMKVACAWPTDSIIYADFSRIATLLRSMKPKRVEWSQLKGGGRDYFQDGAFLCLIDPSHVCVVHNLLHRLGIESVERTVAAGLNAQAPAGIPSPSLDELAEQQGINPVRTPADIPTLEIDEPDMPPAQEMIQRECRDIEAVLLDKNKAYGNSALDPVRIFSTADPIEQIRVRIDDKLSRIKRGQALGEDVTRDLVGYLILLRVAEKMKGSNCQ